MENGNQAGSIQIGIDGEWSLEDFELFFRRYNEVYSFLNVSRHLMDKDTDEVVRAAISEHTFNRFPWEGGWSSYQSYRSLHRNLFHDERPTVVAMRYGSPGIIEVGGALISILLVQKIVQNYVLHSEEIWYIYRSAHRDFKHRGWLGKDSRLEKLRPSADDLKEAQTTFRALVTLLDLGSIGDWDSIVEDPITGVKILFAFIRRMKELVDGQRPRNSRVDFNLPEDSSDRKKNNEC